MADEPAAVEPEVNTEMDDAKNWGKSRFAVETRGTPGEVSARYAVDASVNVTTADAMKVQGSTGLRHTGGFVSEQFITALRGTAKRMQIFNEMRFDASIGTVLDAMKLPILGSPFDVVPGGKSDADTEAAVFLLDNMEQMRRQTWQSHSRDMLESIEFGFALGEIVLEKREDGRLWTRNIFPRSAETVDRWAFDDEVPDEVIGYIQRDINTGGMVTMPIQKHVHVTFRGRKNNPEGDSLLQWLWRPWRMMRDVENMEAVGVERDVGGMPVFTLPEGNIQTADLTAIKNALKSMRVDENMYMLLPFGSELAAYSAGAKQIKASEVIVRYQKIIFMRAFAQFILLGMDKVGTQALVAGSQDFFSQGLRAIQAELTAAWNQQYVPYLFSFNTFPGMTKLPEIVWAPPGKIDPVAFVNAYLQAVQAGLIDQSEIDIDKSKAREVLDLPMLPEPTDDGEVETPGPEVPDDDPAEAATEDRT